MNNTVGAHVFFLNCIEGKVKKIIQISSDEIYGEKLKGKCNEKDKIEPTNPYSASKAAVIGLTKSVGKELAATGITVNCITPAVIRTRMVENLTPKQVEYMVERIPMGRTGDPEEIASLVTWLSSEECSFSTGAVFDISGGRATY